MRCSAVGTSAEAILLRLMSLAATEGDVYIWAYRLRHMIPMVYGTDAGGPRCDAMRYDAWRIRERKAGYGAEILVAVLVADLLVNA